MGEHGLIKGRRHLNEVVEEGPLLPTSPNHAASSRLSSNTFTGLIRW